MISIVKRLVIGALNGLGYDLIRVERSPLTKVKVGFQYTSLLHYRAETASIPGMISLDSADALYLLCRIQEQSGDVLEVGSWQGKSTSYLAKAVKDSGNGKVFAVDHFKGNPGYEKAYNTGTNMSVTIEDLFRRNISNLGLVDVVSVFPMDSKSAYEKIKNQKFRFIFIDGDHSKSGVEQDIALFCPLLQPGGIVVFDDFDATFPGLVEAVEAWVAVAKPKTVFSQRNMLICKF